MKLGQPLKNVRGEAVEDGIVVRELGPCFSGIATSPNEIELCSRELIEIC